MSIDRNGYFHINLYHFKSPKESSKSPRLTQDQKKHIHSSCIHIHITRVIFPHAFQEWNQLCTGGWALLFIPARSYYFVQQIAVIRTILRNHVGTPAETPWLLSLEWLKNASVSFHPVNTTCTRFFPQCWCSGLVFHHEASNYGDTQKKWQVST